MNKEIEKVLDKIRCAFCLNTGASNEKKVEGHGTAYFCDDCSKTNYHPKFVHHIAEDKVIEVEVPQLGDGFFKAVGTPSASASAPIQQQHQPIQQTTDESAKEIAKAIEADKEEDLE